MASKQETVSGLDVRLTVLRVLMEPPLTLARIMGLSLDDVHVLVSQEYLAQFRKRGLSLRQMTGRLGKSLRTLATISKQAGEGRIVLSGSDRLQAQRVVARALIRPMKRETLSRRVRSLTDHDFELAVQSLIDAGLIEEERGLLKSREAALSMVGDDLDARVESLRHFMGVIVQVVYRRFFEEGKAAVALARVISFSTISKTIDQDAAAQYANIFAWASELEHDASHLCDKERDEIGDDFSDCSVVFCAVTPPKGPQWS